MLAASPRTALISVSSWQDDGTRDTHDVVLAQDGDRCHVFTRDRGRTGRLVAQGLDDDEWRSLVSGLVGARS